MNKRQNNNDIFYEYYTCPGINQFNISVTILRSICFIKKADTSDANVLTYDLLSECEDSFAHKL